MRHGCRIVAFWLACGFAAEAAHGEPNPAAAVAAVAPGELFVERPTLHCLGFRWYVDGDANRNAAIRVDYRPTADAQAEFRRGPDLLRIFGETAYQEDDAMRWSAPNMFAGSLLYLQPATEYDVRLTLVDPDGVEVVRTLTMRTRDVPVRSVGRIVHVDAAPPNKPRPEPNYVGLRAAYTAAVPGDVLLHAGNYSEPKLDPADEVMFRFDRQATFRQPITFRAADDGPVILDGAKIEKLIDCQGSSHHHFEGLVFRNAKHGLYAGRGTGSTDLVVRHCRFEEIAYPLFALNADCRDFYIADNVLTGPYPHWHPREHRKNDSHAMWLMGQGHVVCHNEVRDFWDGINFYGKPTTERDRLNAGNDVYRNRISACADDAVELDFSVHNNRLFENFIFNSYMGISAQPVYAGPAYVVRNVVYNTSRSPLKPNQYPAGLLIYHNTFVSKGSAGAWSPIWQNSQLYNNLFLGGGGRVLSSGTLTPETSRMDYNGWRWLAAEGELPIFWRFPTRVKVGKRSRPAHEFADFASFVNATGYERHHVLLDADSFVAFVDPPGSDELLPKFDLTLREASPAVDAGLPLSGINDGGAGKGPDLGAYEHGADVPHYGPRPSAN